MELFGIKFAPLNVPYFRRIQTLSAVLWLNLLFGPLVGLGLITYIVLFSNYYIFGILYLIWIYFDKDSVCLKGGRRIPYMRQLSIWKHFCDYFPLKLDYKCDLPNDKNYLFCVFPHGLLSAGAFGQFATDASPFKTTFPNLKPHLSTLDLHFYIPFHRELMMSIGGVSVSKESITSVLSSKEKGNVFVLVVGGAAEAIYAKPDTYKIILKNRKGFVKMAIKTGSPLVPVFSFGENDLYDQVSNPPGSLTLKIQNWVKSVTGVAPVLPLGRGIFQYSFGPIPRRSPITTVIGEPIHVPHNEFPEPELIEKYHDLFTKSIVALFEEYKHKYAKNPENTFLVIE